jgi:hypothetical protein
MSYAISHYDDLTDLEYFYFYYEFHLTAKCDAKVRPSILIKSIIREKRIILFMNDVEHITF